MASHFVLQARQVLVGRLGVWSFGRLGVWSFGRLGGGCDSIATDGTLSAVVCWSAYKGMHFLKTIIAR